MTERLMSQTARDVAVMAAKRTAVAVRCVWRRANQAARVQDMAPKRTAGRREAKSVAPKTL